MNSAPVGFQCPECVRRTSRRREPRTSSAVGSRPEHGDDHLIGICVAIFVVQFLVGVNAVASDWGMWPAAVAVNDEWYRLLTSVFLHGSWLHLAFNMYVLYVLGPRWRDCSGTSGSWRCSSSPASAGRWHPSRSPPSTPCRWVPAVPSSV